MGSMGDDEMPHVDVLLVGAGVRIFHATESLAQDELERQDLRERRSVRRHLVLEREFIVVPEPSSE